MWDLNVLGSRRMLLDGGKSSLLASVSVALPPAER